jgi:hypothetical protein
MGIWDSIKNVGIKAKCGLGFHSGTNKNIAGKPECYFEKYCPDCGKTIRSFMHEYLLKWDNAPFENANSCSRVQKCRYCQEEARQTVHVEYEEDGKNDRCQYIERCVRCRDTKIGAERHLWHRLPSPDDGALVRMQCYACKKIERRPLG